MNKKKFCSFYVSEYHLLTILLPYINEQINNSKNIEVVLENDMTECVKKYLNRYEINNISKIIKLNWKKMKNEEIQIKENTDTVIVCGKESFIRKINIKIEEKGNVKEVINCFNIENLSNLDEVVKGHDFILRTNGLCEIRKSSHNEQKRKTIQTQI